MEVALSPDELLRQYRKKPLFDPDSLPVQLVCTDAQIKAIIPQRPPLLFVDGLTGLDINAGLIAGYRQMNPADPVFSGHFPDYPVYPGTFTVEMIGQLGLCLYYFVNNQRIDIGLDARPIRLRATKLPGALFLEPILPGDTVILLAKRLVFDGFYGSIIGQALVRGKVAVVAMGEVMILED